ncbi:pesticin C-terminus-like muramidase [Aeromonas popoffii]|uniref:pesticin C-terminus-like muramidase n=1 Tax=Aeromonas popoffii TaxID=70856 RepID=UPI000B214A03|nr:pesticin C-terminus-like muramidase [Aeromonas popoffii]
MFPNWKLLNNKRGRLDFSHMIRPASFSPSGCKFFCHCYQTCIVFKGKLTFDEEGNDVENSILFSRTIHWLGNSESGVTIGRGYDLGNRSKTELYRDLSGSGVPDNIASLISNGAGMKGVAASNFVSANKSSTLITRKSQYKLFEKIYPDYVLRAKSNYERWTIAQHVNDANISGVSISDKTNWENLGNKVKDVIVDLVYQGFTKGPKPMIYGMLNDRQKYADYIRNNPTLSQYEPGRKRAKCLTGE